MPRTTVTDIRLTTLTQQLSKHALACDIDAALNWLMQLPAADRHALAPACAQLLYEQPPGNDSRNWGDMREVLLVCLGLCARKPSEMELYSHDFGMVLLRQLLARSPLPWLDAMRKQAERRGWAFPHDMAYPDELWLVAQGHVNQPYSDRLRARLMGGYPFVATQGWSRNAMPAPDLAQVPAEFWQHDLWQMFMQPDATFGLEDEWLSGFVQAAGHWFSRADAIAQLLASLHVPAFKQPGINWRVQILAALAPTPAEWAPRQPELLLSLASAKSTVQGLALQAWLVQVQDPALPNNALPLAALLQELGAMWAVKTKAVHKQVLQLLGAVATRIAREPDAALQAQLHTQWLDTTQLGLIQPDASHQKRLLQLLQQAQPDAPTLAAQLASVHDLIGQAGRQWLAGAGVDVHAARAGAAPEAESLGMDASPIASSGTCAEPEPEPVNALAGTFEDWALDLVAALRPAAAWDVPRWYRALHGMAVHLPGIGAEQVTQLSPAWMQANTGAADGLSTLLVSTLQRIAADSPAVQTELTRLQLSAEDKLEWQNRASHANALRDALAHPCQGPLLQLARLRMRSNNAALRAMPLLSAPSHAGGRIAAPVLLERVAALAALGVRIQTTNGTPSIDASTDIHALTQAPLHADLQLALHRLWLPGVGSAAHAQAVQACTDLKSSDSDLILLELSELLLWLLSAQHAVPSPFAPQHPAWWADAALAHGRATAHPALQVGEHPLATYAAMRFELANLLADDPKALAPEPNAAEGDAARPHKAREALMTGWLVRRARELGLESLAPYLVHVGQPYRWMDGGEKQAAEGATAMQLQQLAGNSWAADALRRFRVAYRHLRLDAQPALWAERAIAALRGHDELQRSPHWLPGMPALWVGASLGDFHEVVVGPVRGRAPNWPDATQLRWTLDALHPNATGPWDDARCTVLALALADKDAATRMQGAQGLAALLRTQTVHRLSAPSAAQPHSLAATSTATATTAAAAPPPTAECAMARVLALLLRNQQLALTRLTDCLRNDVLPEPGAAPALALLLLLTLAQLPAEPLRGHKALLELTSDALGQSGGQAPARNAVLNTAPEAARHTLYQRLAAWAQAGSTKASAKSLQQVLA